MRFSMKSGLLTVAVVALSVVSACKKPCKDVICDNNGTPTEDGKECYCACPVGFEGDVCEKLSRAAFISNWDGSEVCGSGSTIYSLRITAGDSATAFNISNIGDFGYNHIVTAVLESSTKANISEQITGGKTFSGDISIDGNEITLNYTVSQGSASYSCSGTFTRIE